MSATYGRVRRNGFTCIYKHLRITLKEMVHLLGLPYIYHASQVHIYLDSTIQLYIFTFVCKYAYWPP